MHVTLNSHLSTSYLCILSKLIKVLDPKLLYLHAGNNTSLSLPHRATGKLNEIYIWQGLRAMSTTNNVHTKNICSFPVKCYTILSVQFSRSAMSDSLRPHELQLLFLFSSHSPNFSTLLLVPELDMFKPHHWAPLTFSFWVGCSQWEALAWAWKAERE